jgi:hypothetical protein
VTEEHRGAKDLRDQVRDTLNHDVQREAVDEIVEPARALGAGMNVGDPASEDDGPSEAEIMLDSSERLHGKKCVSRLFCQRRLGTHLSQRPVLRRTREHNAVSLHGFAVMSVVAESTSR